MLRRLSVLQDLANQHGDTEVAEMSALLCSSILSRGLSPAERQRERDRAAGIAGRREAASGEDEREARVSRLLRALDAAEEDLASEAVPIRARGVVTITRSARYRRTMPRSRRL